MKRLVALLLLLPLPALAAPPFVVELSGSPYNRGLIHGRTLKAEIQRSVGVLKTSVKEETGADPDVFLAEFLRDHNHLPAARRWTPELVEEVRGIADGAEIPFEIAWIKQLGDELWTYEAERQAAAPATTPNHCSAAGVPRIGAKPAYVAQNMDIESLYDGLQSVLHIREENGVPEQYIFTDAGELALNGMNNRSIGVVVNTLGQLRSSPDGLPLTLVVRGILSKTTGTEALAFLKAVNHASGQNFIIGAGDRVFDFEASAGKVVPYAPHGQGKSVCHTNHPLVNDDYNERYLARMSPKGPTNSEIRLASLQRRLGGDGSGSIEAALRSKDDARNPVCRPLGTGNDDFTFGSVIMTLSDRPSFTVAAGPPDQNPYRRFEFERVHRAR